MEIFSIFGVCEAAAAETLIQEGVATKIEKANIPKEMMFNVVNGQTYEAMFAVAVPAPQLARFEELCKEMRA